MLHRHPSTEDTVSHRLLEDFEVDLGTAGNLHFQLIPSVKFQYLTYASERVNKAPIRCAQFVYFPSKILEQRGQWTCVTQTDTCSFASANMPGKLFELDK